MTPEERQQFEQLKKEIEDIKNASNNQAFYNFIRKLIKDKPTVVDSEIDRSITVGVGGGTFSVLDYPDVWLNFTLDGEIYRVGAWLKKNDSSR